MKSDRGSGTVLVLTATAIVALASVAVAALGMLHAARATAQNAADAAALAAAPATYPPVAAHPSERANEIALANGALLLQCECPVDPSLATRVAAVRVAVTVRVPIFGAVEVIASSRAEFDPSLWLGVSEGHHSRLG